MLNTNTASLLADRKAVEPLAAQICDAALMLGVQRTTIYRLMDEGLLDSIKIGKRRLVLIDSVHRLVNSRKVAAKTDRVAA